MELFGYSDVCNVLKKEIMFSNAFIPLNNIKIVEKELDNNTTELNVEFRTIGSDMNPIGVRFSFIIKDKTNPKFTFIATMFYKVKDEIPISFERSIINDLRKGFMAELIPSGLSICLSDNLMSIVYVNDNFWENFGFTSEIEFMDAYDGSYLNAVHEKDRAMLIEARKKDTYRKRYRVIKKDGSIAYLIEKGQKVQTDLSIPVVVSIFLEITESKEMKDDFIVMQESYKLALANSNIYVWEYNLEDNTMTVCDFLRKKFLIPKKINGYKSFVELVTAEEYQENFLNFFKHMKSVPSDKMEVLLRTPDGENEYYICQYVSCFDDEGKTIRTTGILESLTEKKAIESKYREELDFINEFDSISLIGYVRANLTKNLIEDRSPQLSFGLYLDKDSKWNDVITCISNEIISEEDKKNFYEKMNRNNLQNQYRKGLQEFEAEYKRQVNNRMQFVRTVIKTKKNPETNELIAFMYSKNITSSKIGKSIVDKIVSTDYDYISYIIINTGESFIYSSNQTDNLPPFYTNNYEEENQTYIKKNVVGEDKAKCIKKTSVDYLVNALRIVDQVSDVYMFKENDKVHYKRITISYLDESKDILLFTRNDVTDIYLAEEEKKNILESALQKAKSANEAKTDFLSRVSHDIRTPLNAIIGLSDVAKLRNENDFIRKLLVRLMHQRLTY